MSEEQKEMQVEAAEKAAKKVAPVTTAEPEENFDWDAYENDAVVPASEKDALTQKYAETLSKVGEKEVVEGTVISMNKREVVVNIGYKSDGIISLNEFRYNPELKVGDKVEVYVETQEDKKGQLTLSHKQARALRSWDRVNEALVLRSTLNRSVITTYMSVKQWNSKWLKSTRNSKTLLYHTKLLSKLNWNSRRKTLFLNWKKDRYLKELLKISLLTVYSSTSVAKKSCIDSIRNIWLWFRIPRFHSTR